LHQGGLKEVIKADMQKIPELLAGSQPVEKAGGEEPPEQLTLF